MSEKPISSLRRRMLEDMAVLPLSRSRRSAARSLDELDHGVDRLARRDDEAAASFDKGD
jgi:hypothetical protein